MKTQQWTVIGVAVGLAAGIALAAGSGDRPVGDAEAAKHGADAAQHQVVDQETSPAFIFRQIDLPVLSHYSYMIGGQGEVLVVDPSRDIDIYVKTAAELGAKITGIYLTHSHADFVAGHSELHKLTGAPIYINRLAGAGYEHTPVDDQSEIAAGRVRCVVRTTPGHTPDSTCLFAYTPASAAEPSLCFTGDTLFIGSVGRPDLMGGSHSAAELAAMIYRTWFDVLSKVPDSVKVYPAHGAGSLCGAHLSEANVSTFGEQKRTNPYLRHTDMPSFIAAVIGDLPDAPQYFAHNAAMNKAGPPLCDWTRALPPPMAPSDAAAREKAGAWLIDVRDAAAFASAHVPNAINIPVRGRFETWVGIMIPWGEPFVLIGEEGEVREAAFRLYRIGYDAPAGYLQGGMDAWQAAGLPVQRVTLVQPSELKAQLDAGTAPILVDVRLPREWMGERIVDTMLNMPINELARLCRKLDPSMPVMTVCNSAYRSSMGASVLLKAGFKNLLNLAGGGEAWVAAGLPTYRAQPAGVAGAAPAVAFLDLPEPVSPIDLARRLMDLPGSLEVVDVRPAWQFAEYHIPGSVNGAPSDVMNSPAYLVGRTPLVIVCRDGSVSASIGGALAAKTERPIRFLSGGVTAYWNDVMTPGGIMTESPAMPSRVPAALPASPPAAAPVGPAPSPAPPAAPVVPKKRPSAGC